MTKIGDQDGIVAYHNRMRDLDPKGTKLVKGADGKWPSLDTLTLPLNQWGAIDKHQRTDQILKNDHDGVTPDPQPEPPDIIVPTAVECGVFVAGGAGGNMSDPDSPQPDTGRDYQGRPWGPEQACNAFRNSGYNACLVQLYRDLGGEYMNYGQMTGMKVGLWDAWPSASRAELALSFHPDMYVAQAETGQGQAAIDAIEAAFNLRPDLPLGIVTNLEPSRTMAGFDEFMTMRGVIAMPECYANENPDWNADPRGFVDALTNECMSRGYKTVIPVLGVYWGWTVEQYEMEPEEIFYPYLAEDMNHAELC